MYFPLKPRKGRGTKQSRRSYAGLNRIKEGLSLLAANFKKSIFFGFLAGNVRGRNRGQREGESWTDGALEKVLQTPPP